MFSESGGSELPLGFISCSPQEFNMMCIVVAVFLILIAAPASISAAGSLPSCLDDDGNQVDWYIVYKLPLLDENDAPFNTGYSYAYITSENVKERDPTSWTAPADTDLDSIVFLNRFKALLLSYLRPSRKLGRIKAAAQDRPKEDNLKWTISSKIITDPQSMVLRTLNAAYDGKHDRVNSIFYNDAPFGLPKKGSRKNSAKAHAKGSILIDEDTGDSLWLTHSVSAQWFLS